MKIIAPDNYASDFTSLDGNIIYPPDNIDNDYPRIIAKGASSIFNVTAQLTSGSEVIGIDYTNATSVTCYIRTEPRGIDWQDTSDQGIDWQDTSDQGIDWQVMGSPAEQTVTHGVNAVGVGRSWIEYTQINAPHAADFTFTVSGGDDAYVGVIRAGLLKTYDDPLSGIEETISDNSQVTKMASGGFHIKSRAKQRILNFTLVEDRATDFYELMHEVLTPYSPGPMFWRVMSDKNTDWEWIIFAINNTTIKSYHEHLSHTRIEITLTEML